MMPRTGVDRRPISGSSPSPYSSRHCFRTINVAGDLRRRDRIIRACPPFLPVRPIPLDPFHLAASSLPGWPNPPSLIACVKRLCVVIGEPCFSTTFLPAPTPLGFWTRRQAHEALIHRVDVELAVGAPSAIEPRLAADGIDEMLNGWVVDPLTPFQFEHHGTLLVRPDDADARWLTSLGPDGVRTARGAAGAAGTTAQCRRTW